MAGDGLDFDFTGLELFFLSFLFIFFPSSSLLPFFTYNFLTQGLQC